VDKFSKASAVSLSFDVELSELNNQKPAESYSKTLAVQYDGAIENGQILLTREGKISLSWKDDKTLQVGCNGCPTDRKPITQSSWK
jgi:hypothetical protein